MPHRISRRLILDIKWKIPNILKYEENFSQFFNSVRTYIQYVCMAMLTDTKLFLPINSYFSFSAQFLIDWMVF